MTPDPCNNAALEPVYPIVFLDALRVKIRDAESRQVKNKAVYVALGVTPEGEREVLGLWIANNEGAKFWLSIMNNLKNRGLEDILIAVVDGLKGFPDAINAAFPDTTVQTCIVHLVRHSLNVCGWKDRKAVAKDLKLIYQAVDDGEAAKALDDFEAEWGDKYPSIAPSWRRAWQEVIPFFAFPPAVRKIIYTTNAIESLNRVIRKTTKTRGSFPTDAAATKLIYRVGPGKPDNNGKLLTIQVARNHVSPAPKRDRGLAQRLGLVERRGAGGRKVEKRPGVSGIGH